MFTLNAKITATVDADATATLLRQSVRENPTEAAPAAQLVDRLQELAVAPKTAKEWVRTLQLLNLSPDQWPEKDRRKVLAGTTWEALVASVTAANGRRRERTLTASECFWCVLKARNDSEGFHWISGGTVANAYKYPATQTAFVAAVGSNGRVRTACGEASASKGTTPTNALCGLSKRAKKADWLRWADAAPVPASSTAAD